MMNGCCFTGHRSIPDGKSGDLREKLLESIDRLHKDGKIDTFYAGGCTGFDTLAAQTVLEYRAAHPEIRLVLVIPYRKQAKGWSDNAQREYEHIKESATEVVYLAERYYRGCMHQRNRYMVDHSSICVCYLTQEKGGTASTVRYAQRKGLPVCNLASENFSKFCRFPSCIFGKDTL